MVAGIRLNLPLSAVDVAGLKAGDMVLLNGKIITGGTECINISLNKDRKEKTCLLILQALCFITADR